MFQDVQKGSAHHDFLAIQHTGLVYVIEALVVPVAEQREQDRVTFSYPAEELSIVGKDDIYIISIQWQETTYCITGGNQNPILHYTVKPLK